MKSVLVVVAHPDDEVIGCGGTIARLTSQGVKVCTLILGEGITSRDIKRSASRRGAEMRQLRQSARRANKILGVTKLYLNSFPDNRFDTVAFLNIVKAVEKVKNKLHPDTIFTHYEKDLNIDHQLTYKAVLTATRSVPEETVREIFSFEVLSSTEWNYPLSFLPDVFFDISRTIDGKKRAMKEYYTELKEFPHSRSIENIENNARLWGSKTGVAYAEAFECVRIIR